MLLHICEIAGAIVIIALSIAVTHGSNISTKIRAFIQPSQKTETNRNQAVSIGIFILFFILYAFLITYETDKIPTPYHVDEAGMAYDAINIAKYGIDRYSYKYPVYFINFGGGQNALYTYLAAIMIKLFGYSIFIIRLPAIILSLIAAICFSRLLFKRYGYTASIITIALHCLLPFSIMHSRWALESYLLYPMIIISCTTLYNAIRTEKTILFLATGVLLGTTLYSYAISYLLLVLFLALLLPCLIFFHKIRLKNIIALGTPLALLALPLILMLLVNNGIIDEIRTEYISIPKLPVYRGANVSFANIIKNLEFSQNNIFYKIFFTDGMRYNAIPRFGTVYPFSIPFIVSGVLSCLNSTRRDIKNKYFSLDILMNLMFLCSILTSLLIEDININRACEIFFPLIYFLILGIFKTVKNSKKTAWLTAAVYSILFLFFSGYYYSDRFQNDIRKNLVFNSIDDYTQAIDFVHKIKTAKTDKIYVIGRSEAYIYTLLAHNTTPYEISDPYTMSESLSIGNTEYKFLSYIDWDGIPDDYIYIFRDHMSIPWKMDLMNFHTKEFNTIKIYYP